MRIYPEQIKIPSELNFSEKLLNFIKVYEGIHDGDLSKIGLQPKPDPAGIWTEGYGRAMVNQFGEFLRVKDYPTIQSVEKWRVIFTEEDAERDLINGLEIRAKAVIRDLKVNVTQCMFDALVSHRYNCGKSETLYILVNNVNLNPIDEDQEKEQEKLLKKIKSFWVSKYITSGGKFYKGLQYRRNDEFEIFIGKNYDREYNLTI